MRNDVCCIKYKQHRVLKYTANTPYLACTQPPNYLPPEVSSANLQICGLLDIFMQHEYRNTYVYFLMGSY